MYLFIVHVPNFWREHHKSEMDPADIRVAVGDKLSTEQRRLKNHPKSVW